MIEKHQFSEVANNPVCALIEALTDRYSPAPVRTNAIKALRVLDPSAKNAMQNDEHSSRDKETTIFMLAV